MARDTGNTGTLISGAITHNVGTGNFAFSGWLYLNSGGTEEAIINYGAAHPELYIGTDNPATIKLFWSGVDSFGSTNTAALSAWHSFVFQKVGDNFEMWLNNVRGANRTGFSSASLANDAIKLLCGDGIINGAISDVAFWTRALTSAEIAELHSGNSPIALVNQSGLFSYWRLTGSSSPEPDEISGYDLTVTGTTQVASPSLNYDRTARIGGGSRSKT
jgi:hypothetical protein